jgi:hypothetical protein
VVRQRLRLASVSPRLLDVYAEDGLTLDQLMAFTVNGDHARQEQVFERLSQSYTKEPYVIRRMLTEGAVAADKRAQFIGLDAYEEAGGTLLHDLFQGDDGGWLQDVALVDRLVADKLEHEVEAIRAEGWKWIEIAPEFAYGHTYGLRQLRGEEIPLTAEDEAARDALQAEYGRIEETYAEAEELPEEDDQRLPKSRQLSPPSRSGPSVSIRSRSRAPAPLSASMAAAISASIAAMFVRRTKHPSSLSRSATQNTMASGQSPHRWTLTPRACRPNRRARRSRTRTRA